MNYHASTTVNEQDVITALRVWRSKNGVPCTLHWTTQKDPSGQSPTGVACKPPTLLRHARHVCGVISPKLADELTSFLDIDHIAIAAELLNHPTGNAGTNRELAERMGSMMQFLVGSALAARGIVHWEPGESVTDATCGQLRRVVKVYPYRPTHPVQASMIPSDGIGAGQPKTDLFLNACFEQDVFESGIDTTTFASLHRLLSYIVAGQETRTDHSSADPIVTRMLLAHKTTDGWGGEVRKLAVFAESCHVPAWYIDPVTTGLTVFDRRLTCSIELAWKRCQQAMTHEKVLRIAPDTTDLYLLKGSSAGGLLACAMYAAADPSAEPLDFDATAAVALFPSDLPDAEIEVSPQPSTADVPIYDVSPDSLEAKLLAAHADGIRRVVLTRPQAQLALNIPREIRPHVEPAETLPEASKKLTGDARLERILETYCEWIEDDWSEKCNVTSLDEADAQNVLNEHRVDRFVFPSLSLMPRGKAPYDTRISTDRKADDAQADDAQHDPYEPIASQGAESLWEFLASDRWLCITEDAGAGKSVLMWRAQVALSSYAGRDRFFDGKPPLVVRWEGSWPKSGQHVELKLVDALASELERLDIVSDGDLARQVADYALRNQRVVLMLDALDQFTHRPWEHAKQELSQTGAVGQRLDACRVILTSRPYKLESEQTFFEKRRWRFGRIDGFNDAELQDQYFPEPYRTRWRSLIAQLTEVDELLRSPLVLRMLLEILETGAQTQTFRNRGEIYLEVTQRLLQRAIDRADVTATEHGWLSESDMRRSLQRIIGLIAFEMMVDGESCRYVNETDTTSIPGSRVDGFLEHVESRLMKHIPSHKLDETYEQWKQAVIVLQKIDWNNRGVLKAYNKDSVGFRDLKTMEFHAGYHLANYATKKCRKTMKRFTNAGRWESTWRFVIDLPFEGRNEDVVARSLGLLLGQPDTGRRPTELIYRAWHLLEVDSLLAQQMFPLSDNATVDECQNHRANARRQAESLLLRTDQRDKVLKKFRKGNQLPLPPLLHREMEQLGTQCRNGTFIVCPQVGTGNELMMGGDAYDDEKPVHPVSLGMFALQSTHVTRQQYTEFDPTHAADKYVLKYSTSEDCPIVNVSFFDSFAFCKWLGAQYRLPTEAEWEFACRAGTQSSWSCDESQLEEHALFGKEFDHGTCSVYDKRPNPWGMRHMHGNAWEWVGDWFDDRQYEKRARWIAEHGMPYPNPVGPSVGSSRVLRGGAFIPDSGYCRSAYRFGGGPGDRSHVNGFRVLLEL